MSDHHPLAFANSLSAKLAARSRHVAVLLGAGAARSCGLPDVAALEAAVEAKLEGEQQEKFKQMLAGRNLEQVLSRLRRIAALLEDDDQTVDGLTADAARGLDAALCRLIIAELDIEKADLDPMLQFAAWVARADYHQPIEIFTVNYDLLIEMALERLRVAYFDGFVGSLRGTFRTDLVEASPTDDAWLPSFVARLWKLHGSVSWEWEREAEVVRLGRPVGENRAAAIYPSDTKYEESRRVPFVVLHDRLRRALYQPETLVVVAGYSWNDDHLNELLFDAVQHRPRSEVVAFCHSTIPDVLLERATAAPNLQVIAPSNAVLSGVLGDWTAPEDAPEDIWVEGKLALGDFGSLGAFLARSSPRQGELEARLASILASAASDAGG